MFLVVFFTKELNKLSTDFIISWEIGYKVVLLLDFKKSITETVLKLWRNKTAITTEKLVAVLLK